MTTKGSGGPLPRGTAAAKTRNHHEAGPRSEFNAPGRQAGRILAGHGQYQIDYDRSQSTGVRFDRFHANNPHVYRLLVDLAREWVRATGRTECGMRMLWERARWELSVTTDETCPTLNDHYPPYYARLIEYQEPDLRGVFERRRSPEADGWIALRKHRVTA